MVWSPRFSLETEHESCWRVICGRLEGLVNGAVGTVLGVIYRSEEKPPAVPTAVVVQFDDYRGPSFLGGVEKVVPICPIKRSWENQDGGQCSRLQLPLTLAHAVTVHKAQGATLPKAAVDLEEREFAAGMSFVAMSRVKRFGDLCFTKSFPFERLPKLRSSKSGVESVLQQRVKEGARLAAMSGDSNVVSAVQIDPPVQSLDAPVDDILADNPYHPDYVEFVIHGTAVLHSYMVDLRANDAVNRIILDAMASLIKARFAAVISGLFTIVEIWETGFAGVDKTKICVQVTLNFRESLSIDLTCFVFE